MKSRGGVRIPWKKLPEKKLVLAIIIIAVFSSFVVVYVDRVVRSLPFFSVRQVLSRGGVSSDYSFLKGKNIFSIDLAYETRRLSFLHPEYRDVRVIKVFPDKLFVDFVRRVPVAGISWDRIRAVDEDGVIFEFPPGTDPGNLPVIAGLEKRTARFRMGMRTRGTELSKALKVIAGLKALPALRVYAVKVVQLKEYPTLLCTLSKRQPVQETGGKVLRSSRTPEQDMEVQLHADTVDEGLAILAGILAQERQGIEKIKYIDLRFNNPVIKLKNAQ
jgi:cell division septal protein FtsQ